MPEFFLLGAQVSDIAVVRRDFERHARDVDPVAAEALDLVRIVGQQPHLADTEVAQNLRADPVIAQVLLESQLQIRLDGVQPGVLQRVGANLVAEPDTAALLMKINHYAAIRREDSIDRFRNCSPQSHRAEANTSPVRHSEWSRTSAGRPPPTLPLISARCSRPSTMLRKMTAWSIRRRS